MKIGIDLLVLACTHRAGKVVRSTFPGKVNILLGILVQVNGSNDEKETEIETDIYIC
jgi:hypothetical protein